MRTDIIEINALPNRPHDDFVVAVAIKTSADRWEARMKQVNSLSDEDIDLVANSGIPLTEGCAKGLFVQYISMQLKYT